MARSRTSSPYSPNLSGMDSQTVRVFRDLIDRIDFLTGELDRVRSHPTLSQAFVSQIGQSANPEGMIRLPGDKVDGHIQINKDGLVVNYSSPVDDIFPYVDITSVGNIGAGTDTLHTLTIEPKTLASVGDYLRYVYSGTFSTNDNDKRVIIRIDGQVVEDFGNFDFDTGIWYAMGEYTRLSSTTLRSSYMAMYGTPLVINDSVIVGGTQDIIFLPRNALITLVNNLDLNPIVMDVQAVGTANDDIVQNLSIVERFKAKTVKTI